MMAGVTLSRWTMSYFAAALAAFVTAQCLMALGYGFPNAAVSAPQTLVVVHLIAIGWLSLLLCGALFQFVPVLVARPLYSDWLPLPALICLLIGLAGLICGFLQLAGTLGRGVPWFAVGAACLGTGFAVALWNLGCTLWLARPLPLLARFVVVGLFSLATTATFGIVFALMLGNVTDYRPFDILLATGVPIHVVLGFGGWLTFTVMGVSYRLLAMFMLAPELDRRSSRAVLYFGTAALGVTVIGGLAQLALEDGLTLTLLAACILGLAALSLYEWDILYLYRARKRRAIELNSRMAAFALASLGLSVLLTIVLLALNDFGRYVGSVVFLVAFGWLSGLGLAKLYKIVAFLTWLESYGPVLGKTRTPRVQDLVVEPRAIKWFMLYFVAVWGGTAALLANSSTGFRGAAALMTIATIGIILQLARTRRLADVPIKIRLPTSVQRPRLLISSVRQ